MVDDDEDARLLLKDVMIERGATVAEASSAGTAFITAHARDPDGERAFAAGFQRFASKPVDLGHLVSMVANLRGISFGEQRPASTEP